MRQMNNSFINKYGFSTLLLQSSIIVLLALFFLLAPSTVLAEEITDKENTLKSESLDDDGNSEITKDDDTTTEDTAETDEAVEDESITDDQLDSDETKDIENVDRDEIDDIDEEVENDGDENVDGVDEETEDVDDTDEIDEEEIDREHDEDIIEEEGSEETDSDEPESEDEAQEDEDLIDESDEEAAEEDEAEDETKKDESSKEDGTSKQSPSKSTTSVRSNSELGNGDRDKRVVQLKKDLARLGFNVPGNGTDQFGPQTEKQVKALQKYYGLKETGTLNKATADKISAQISSPFQNGKRHNDTSQLKRDLNKIGFGGITVTTLFSDFTEKRVREFQQYFGLKVNGIADEITHNKIKSVANSSLQNGKRHNDTLQLKRNLNKIGFGGITVTNLFSDFTEKRVREFQQYYNLKVNGIVDDKTNNKIKSVANSSLQNGKRHNDTLQLKRNLNKIGFGGITVTTLFSDFTEKRVREFQDYFGLKVNGIVDDKTNNKIKSVANSSLQNGKRHNDTLQLKRDLNKIGFGGITVTTLFSDFTEKRVREFQEYFGLKINGIADEITQSKIKSVVNSPLQNGKRHNDTLQLKRDLNKIGFGGITVTTLFSDFTEKRVKEFQRHYGLKVSGIAEEVTLAKITEIAAKPSKVIYLDAGHGGSDPGAIGNGLHEKDVTLDIALRTKKELEAAGYTVIMSRTTDKYLSLSERTNHANRVNADIFVSIHNNAGGGTGIETWKMANGPKPNESNTLATHIQNETIKQTGERDRGVKDANLHVNRESNMPSALVEIGFIDTVSDANKLKQASFKNKAAKGIANGIKKYFA